MTPEQLLQKMFMGRTNMFGASNESVNKENADMLRIVLQAIKDGEVVEYSPKYDDGVLGDVILKPDFQKWMEK